LSSLFFFFFFFQAEDGIRDFHVTGVQTCALPIYRSMSGGTTELGWAAWNFPWATMTQPIVCPPYNPGRPADARIVAVAAGQRVFVSNDFAGSWPVHFDIPAGASIGAIFAMSFASPTRLFMGT